MGCGIEGLFLRNRVRAEHADRTGSRTVRSIVAARHGRCTEAASSSSNATFKKSSAIAERARRVAAPAPQQQTVQPGVRGAAGERANGPVVGYLASQSGTGTKTDTPILDHTAVDLGRDQGSDRRPGRSEPRRGVALYARRLARYASAPPPSSTRSSFAASTHRAISMAFGCRSIPERNSPFRRSKLTVLNGLKC